MDVSPRALDRARDLPGVAALVARRRVGGGIWHPGGIQWWLRQTLEPGFEAHVVDGGAVLDRFVLIDRGYVIAIADDPAAELALVDWATEHLRRGGAGPIEVSILADDAATAMALAARGFAPSDTWGDELMLDLAAGPPPPRLPAGFTFGSLESVDDEALVAVHRASWSDRRPSPYRRALHDLVTSAPQFRRDLVTVALAPDGTPAASCIGWLDETTRTLEIEPLGTHAAYRRLGLGHAIVAEVSRRAWVSGMEAVLVWGTSGNAPAHRLYTSSGFTPRRRVIELRRTPPTSASRGSRPGPRAPAA